MNFLSWGHFSFDAGRLAVNHREYGNTSGDVRHMHLYMLIMRKTSQAMQNKIVIIRYVIIQMTEIFVSRARVCSVRRVHKHALCNVFTVPKGSTP